MGPFIEMRLVLDILLSHLNGKDFLRAENTCQ